MWCFHPDLHLNSHCCYYFEQKVTWYFRMTQKQKINCFLRYRQSQIIQCTQETICLWVMVCIWIAPEWPTKYVTLLPQLIYQICSVTQTLVCPGDCADTPYPQYAPVSLNKLVGPDPDLFLASATTVLICRFFSYVVPSWAGAHSSLLCVLDNPIHQPNSFFDRDTRSLFFLGKVCTCPQNHL